MRKFSGAIAVLVCCLLVFAANQIVNRDQQVQAAPAQTRAVVVSVARVRATLTPDSQPRLFIASPEAGREIDWPGVVRQRFVTVDLQLLASATRLTLNLFDDSSYTAVLDSRQSRREALGAEAGDGLIWQGHIEGVLGSQVTLVSGTSWVAGNIFTTTGRDYIVRYADDGINSVHGVYEIDASRIPPPDERASPDRGFGLGHFQADTSAHISSFGSVGSISDPQAVPKGSAGNPDEHVSSKDIPLCITNCPAEIGLLVVYTPAAVAHVGGTQALLNLVVLGLNDINNSFSNSHIDNHNNKYAHMYLAHFNQVNYVEVGWSTDLARLQDPNDGYMDEVHGWRNTLYSADLVTLVTHEASPAAGAGYAYTPNDPDPPRWGFNWVNVGSVGGSALTHEIGHNMGGGHARWDSVPCGSAPYACGYGVDYGTQSFHTVMAYNPPSGNYAIGIPYFSNPDIDWCGNSDHLCFPTGIDPNNPQSGADNALMLTTSAPIIAHWR